MKLSCQETYTTSSPRMIGAKAMSDLPYQFWYNIDGTLIYYEFNNL